MSSNQLMSSGLSSLGQASLAAMVVAEAIAVADGWRNLDEVLSENSELINDYLRFADAALCAINRINYRPALN